MLPDKKTSNKSGFFRPMVVDEGGEMGGPPAVPAAAGGEKEGIWDRVIKGLIYALVLALPLLFTGWTFEPLEFSKQMLLFLLTSAAAIAWILKLLVLREMRLIKTPLDLPIGIFLLVYLVASVFSVDRVASFLGFYGSFHGNFFQVLFLILFYYIVVNNFDSPRKLKKLIGIFLFSLSLAYIYILLQFFGFFIWPFEFAKVTNFNSLGGLLAISLLGGFGIVMSLDVAGKSWLNIFSGRLWRIILIVIAFVVLLTINFVFAWVALLTGLLLYLIFQVAISKQFSVRGFVVPLGLLIVTAAFLVIQLVFPTVSVRNIFGFNLPSEVRLDYKTATPVLVEAIQDRPIFGLGPNTFLYAFSQYRGSDFNLSPFWNVRFDRAPSEAAEYLVGSGILGFLAFEILNLIFIIYALFYLFRARDKGYWGMALTLFSAFIVIWVAHWFFFFNTVASFSLWLTMASFVVLARSESLDSTNTLGFSFA